MDLIISNLFNIKDEGLFKNYYSTSEILKLPFNAKSLLALRKSPWKAISESPMSYNRYSTFEI